MNDKKKQLNQIIILTVLLVGLGFSIWNMARSVSGGGAPAPQPQEEMDSAQAPVTRVTPMGQIVTEGEVQAPDQFKEEGYVGALNTNVFKVHDINPARDPFKREEGWFSDEVAKIPGRNLSQDWINEMTDEVPDMNDVFNTDDEFVEYRMEKRMVEDDYRFTATSEDGRITTDIQARTKAEPTIRVEYSEAEGREVEQVNQPGGAEPGHLPRPDSPFGGDLWNRGDTPGGTSRAPGAGADSGNFITCYGVSIKGDNRSALLALPDGPRLVREGDVLMPGNIKVVRISENGVEIRDIRTAEQILVPLTKSI